MKIQTKCAFSPEPIVKLENWFTEPFNNAVATARTCYSSRVVYAADVDKDEKARERRDSIAQSTYEAGHHTTLQHATFQFILENVSRQFIWSFLHTHPFYNSEQVSQRYVEVQADRFATPPLQGEALSLYRSTIEELMSAYHRLIGMLEPTVTELYVGIFKNRDPNDKRWKGVIKKKAQEVARYVLPLATHAHLYHTISGITLHRYHRLCQSGDAPLETQLIIAKMVAAVNEVDPLFFRHIEEEIPLEETPEYQFFQNRPQLLASDLAESFIQEFDAELGGGISKLVAYTHNAPQVLAQAVRTVLGLPKNRLFDEEAIHLVLDPKQNPLFGESLNLTTLSKLTRTLYHPHFTFRKKLSHTADSQDQRHRMTPASRPLLMRQFVSAKPDVITPALIQSNKAALTFYKETMGMLWQRLSQMRTLEVPDEFVAYLLPNAFPIRFEESGDLLNFHHKWTKRLCYTAQEEIWKASQEEVLQLKAIFPQLAQFLLAPCGLRSRAAATPYCPEGDRFCGLPVWKLPVTDYTRTL